MGSTLFIDHIYNLGFKDLYSNIIARFPRFICKIQSVWKPRGWNPHRSRIPMTQLVNCLWILLSSFQIKITTKFVFYYQSLKVILIQSRKRWIFCIPMQTTNFLSRYWHNKEFERFCYKTKYINNLYSKISSRNNLI